MDHYIVISMFHIVFKGMGTPHCLLHNNLCFFSAALNVEERVINSVPYLSPLVLRKELENLLANSNDGGVLLQSKRFVEEKSILYWNLVSTFFLLYMIEREKENL